MKIKKLWISSYKNLNKVTIDFKTDLITLLVGQNGLGKSNLLEAIAVIFRDLDLIESEQDWEDWSSKDDHFDFDITYQCKASEIRISCLEGVFLVATKGIDEEYLQEIDFATFYRNKKNLTPDYILGYYSGDNDRIQTFFAAHAKRREANLKSSTPSKDQPALGKMFFAHQNYGELLFFAMWIFKHLKPFDDKIKKLLGDYLNIDLNSKLLIAFNNPTFYKTYPDWNAENLLTNIEAGVERPFWGITGNINQLLLKFWENNSRYAEPIAFEDPFYYSDKDVNEFVSFNNLDFDKLVTDLKGTIDDPIHLFDVLQAADELGIIYQIRGEISKKGLTVSHDYAELSEGEQQLLTVLGLILVTGREDCLFLLDEPDTHLNPQWQRNYINLLREFNLNDDKSHIIVATHSPLIVQAVEKDEILLFKAFENAEIHISDDVETFENWRIDQVLTSEYFELKSARPKRLDDFMAERESLLSKPQLSPEDLTRLKELEEGIGLLPTGETINDFQALHLIRSIVQEAKENDQNK